MRSLCFLTSFLVLTPVFAEDDFQDFDEYQETISPQAAQKALQLYLIKSPEVRDQIGITADALSIYATADDKKNDRPEYVLKFGRKAKRLPEHPRLGNIRIAIDPGHFGGDRARLEERYVDMKGVKFDEGTLAALTGRHLKKLLEDKGATVLLTRDTPGKGVLKESFEEWMKSGSFDKAVAAASATQADPEAAGKWWHTEAKPNDIFRLLYNVEDLRARGKMINDFKPHLTVAIHFNAGAGNDKTTGQNLGTKENYNMLFVPGSFMKNELKDKASRYDFLRLLVTQDLQESIDLAEAMGSELTAKLKVPLIPDNTPVQTNYLSAKCLPVKEGVYCRNLAVTRLPRCATVYGETLYQDNFDECQRLAGTEFEIEGYKTSIRVKEIAEAYFNAIVKVYGE